MIKLNMYINGEWVGAQSGKTRDIVNPANGEIIAQAAEGDVEDARYAIEIARKTFDSGIWSDMPAAKRASYLFAIAEKLEEKAEEIGQGRSGIGRGLGTFGFDEFTEIKQININLQVEPVGWFED